MLNDNEKKAIKEKLGEKALDILKEMGYIIIPDIKPDPEKVDLFGMQISVQNEEELQEVVDGFDKFEINWPCGSYTYTIEEWKTLILKKEDVPCPCGHPKHWILLIEIGSENV